MKEWSVAEGWMSILNLSAGTNLEEILGLDKNNIITSIGAGGKTSLLYYLARRLANVGYRVLLTTTTRIYYLVDDQDRFVAGDTYDLWLKRLERRIGGGQFLVAGRRVEKNKIIGVPPEWVDNLKDNEIFDFILVEGDGSARKPLKAPAEHEPVIPRATDLLLPVIGLTALHRPLNSENVHRLELFQQITNSLPESIITIKDIYDIYTDKRGYDLLTLKDFYQINIIVNQVDNYPLEVKGARLADLFLQASFSQVILTCFQKSQIIRRICR